MYRSNGVQGDVEWSTVDKEDGLNRIWSEKIKTY
jgi:hypothetical protein